MELQEKIINRSSVDCVLRAGAMRNAWTSGVLAGLQECGFDPGTLRNIFACSSSAHVAAFLLAGQIEDTPAIWESLTKPDVFSFWNVLRGKRLGDVDRLVDQRCAGLDVDALDSTQTSLFVAVTDVEECRVKYILCTPENIRDVLKATAVIPLAGRPVYLEGSRTCDGGVYDLLPVKEALRHRPQKLLVISNQPRTHQPSLALNAFLAWSLFANNRKIRNDLLTQKQRYKASRQLILVPPQGTEVFEIAPPHPLGQMMTRNKRDVRAMINKGRGQAYEVWEKLNTFLCS